MQNKPLPSKPIRSFVRRQGRITAAQKCAYERLWQIFGVNFTGSKLNLSQLFQRNSAIVMEIGFGMGEALLQTAKANPDINYLGIDVHKPGIGAALLGIEKENLTNLRLFNADAIEVLTNAIEDNSLAGIHIFFPDPWPKKRHHKRRLINENFVELVKTKLQLDGYLHLATDWEDYAQQMLQILDNIPDLINTAGKGHFIERPSTRPITRFEQRGKRLGHTVWDLFFLKIN